jgi:hypothetical protein
MIIARALLVLFLFLFLLSFPFVALFLFLGVVIAFPFFIALDGVEEAFRTTTLRSGSYKKDLKFVVRYIKTGDLR